MTQDTAIRRHPRGGLYFDDFVVGHLYEHPLRRTVTQMDNMLFSNMTLNPQPLHIDRHFCEQETEWGQPLMNSLFTLGLMIGIMVNDLTVGTTIGLGFRLHIGEENMNNAGVASVVVATGLLTLAVPAAAGFLSEIFGN